MHTMTCCVAMNVCMYGLLCCNECVYDFAAFNVCMTCYAECVQDFLMIQVPVHDYVYACAPTCAISLQLCYMVTIYI